MISSHIQWNKTPRGSWCEKKFRSQSKTRKNSIPFPKQGNLERPQIGQGRARSKRKKPDPINQAINTAIKLVTGNPWKNQNRNKENKQHAYYKQCK